MFSSLSCYAMLCNARHSIVVLLYCPHVICFDSEADFYTWWCVSFYDLSDFLYEATSKGLKFYVKNANVGSSLYVRLNISQLRLLAPCARRLARENKQSAY